MSSNRAADTDAPPPVQPAKFIVPMGVEARPIQLDRVVFRAPRDQVIGSVRGMGCVVEFEPIFMDSSRVDVDPTSYADIFRGVLNSASHNVVGDGNALFEDREADTAEFLVGGLVQELNVKTCQTFIGSGHTGEASMEVEWQVYDNQLRRVVYSTSTSGSAKVPGQANSAVAAMMDAFEMATEKLLFDKGFYDTVTNARGGNTAASAAPDNVTTISDVPLKTGRFQDDITFTRASVATILRGQSHGSGFFISDNLLVTNEHVVGGSTVVIVKMVTGRELVGEVVATNATRDVALVRTESSGLGGLALNTSEPTVGSQVFVVGSPMDEDLESTVSAGIISAFRTLDDLRYIQSDVSVLPGNSGGPMFDDKGNVIAITVIGMFGQGSGLNLFIPIGEALDALNIQVSDE